MNKGEKAVRYMRRMATGCRWRVLHEIRYQKADGSEITFIPGVWYTGIPYTQGRKKRLYCLLRFKLCLLGGFLFIKKSLVGCDCSSAASFAWKKVNWRIPVLSTRKMLKDLYGEQHYISNQQRYTLPEIFSGTKVILQQNSQEIIFEAYNALKAGDGLLQYDMIEKRGHIMLVSSEPDDGKITIIDQKGFGEGGSERIDTSWRIDFSYSYKQLIEEGYLPIYQKSTEGGIYE